MNQQRLAAIILIASVAIFTLSGPIGAPGVYATQDINQRLQIVETYKTRWLIAQALIGVFILLTPVGFALLASTLRKKVHAWVLGLGTAAIAIGSIVAFYFLYLQTTDPRGGYSGAYIAPENLAYWLWLAGMLLVGIAMLQAGLPAWLGYLTAGTAVIYGIVFLLTGAGFITPFLLGLLSLIIAIVLLRIRPVLQPET